MSCYWPQWHSNRRVQVLGPGGRVEFDFLTNPHVAERLAFRRNLEMSEAEQLIMMRVGKMVMPAEVYFQQLREQRANTKSAARPRVRL